MSIQLHRKKWIVGASIVAWLVILMCSVGFASYQALAEPVIVENEAPVWTEEIQRGGITIEKRDFDTGKLTPQGNASIEGTEFSVCLKDDGVQNQVLVNDKLYSRGEEVVHLTIGADGTASTAANALPYGTYTIKEVAASTGYLLTDGEPRTFSVRVDGQIKPYKQQGENGADAAWYNQVKRANMSFSKKLQGTSNKGAWIPFLLTSKSTGETHVVVTDENGYFDTEKYPHSTSTNSMDALIKEATSTDEYTFEYNGKKYTYNKSYLREATDADDFKFEIRGKKYTLDEKKIQLAAAEYGVWFGWDDHHQ